MTPYTPPPAGPIGRRVPLGVVVGTMEHRGELVRIQVLGADGAERWVPAAEAGL